MTNLEWLLNHKKELALHLIGWSERYEVWLARIGHEGYATLCENLDEAIRITLDWLDAEVDNDKS